MRTKRTLTTKELENIIFKINEAASLPFPVAEISLDESAVSIMEAELEKDWNLDFDFDKDPVSSATVAVAPSVRVFHTGTQKITIRIPNEIIDAFKANAKTSGVRYQTSMIKALKSAVTSPGSL